MESIKFLLINPIFQKIDAVYPPLGLCYIASALRQTNKSYQFKIISQDYEKEIATTRPDIVGITSVSKNYNIAQECARLAHAANIPVIMGGVHISMMPQTLTQYMDVAILGEGEFAIKEVMNAFNGHRFDKSALKSIHGIAYNDHGNLKINPPREQVKDLDLIPFPARDLIDIKTNSHMMTGRGCPFHCAFCSTSRYTHNKLRQHSAEYVVNEIAGLYRQYKVSYITIYDDLFTMNTKRVIDIQDGLDDMGLLGKIGYGVNMRADLVTDEMAEILKDMGVTVVGLGLESGCDRTLKYLKGEHNKIENNEKAIRILRKHELRIYGSFIIGCPDEDLKEVEETISFIRKNKIRHFDIGILTPFPGTPVWEYALKRGLVSDDIDWSKLDFRFHNSPIYLSEKISLEEMNRIDKKILALKNRNERLGLWEDFASHPVFYLNLMGNVARDIFCQGVSGLKRKIKEIPAS